MGLDFVPLTRERFDGVILQENFFSPAIQTLLSIIGSAEFRSRLDAMGGYDGTESGRIVYAN